MLSYIYNIFYLQLVGRLINMAKIIKKFLKFFAIVIVVIIGWLGIGHYIKNYN